MSVHKVPLAALGLQLALFDQTHDQNQTLLSLRTGTKQPSLSRRVGTTEI